MRKVTREKWVRRDCIINQSCAQVRVGAKGWKLSSLPSKRARHGIACGIDTFVDPALRGAKQFGECNAIELRSPFFNRITLDVCFEDVYSLVLGETRERLDAKRITYDADNVRRAGATHSRGRDAQRSTFHSYSPCDASLRPVESTRTFVNTFACSVRWCDLHGYVCISMFLAKRWLFGRDGFYFGHLHHVIVSHCNFACVVVVVIIVVFFLKDWNDCLRFV